MNTKKILGVVAVLALVAVAMVGAGAAETQTITVASSEADYTTLSDAVYSMNNSAIDYVINVTGEVNSAGFAISSSMCKSVTINANGATITFTAPAVGSDGTVSQCMQLLSGTKVTLNEGTYQVSNDALSKSIKENWTKDSKIKSYFKYVDSTNGYVKFTFNTTDINAAETITKSQTADEYGTGTVGINNVSNTCRYSDLFATMINSYGTLTLNGVTLDGTNLKRAVDNALYTTDLNKAQNAESTLLVNTGKVTIAGNTTVKVPVTDKGATVRSMSLENQAGTATIPDNYNGGTVTIAETAKFTGEVYVNGSYNKDDNESVLTANGLSSSNLGTIFAGGVTLGTTSLFDGNGTGLTLDNLKTVINDGTKKGALMNVNGESFVVTADVTAKGTVSTEANYTQGTHLTLNVEPTYTFTVPPSVVLVSDKTQVVTSSTCVVTVTSNMAYAGKTMKVTVATAADSSDTTKFSLTSTGGKYAYYNVGKGDGSTSNLLVGSNYAPGDVEKNVVVSQSLTDKTKLTNSQQIYFKTVDFDAADEYSGTLNFQFTVA